MSQWLINNLWEIILLIIGCIFALIKFNYTLFNRVIKTEIENNNLKWYKINAEQSAVRCTQCHNCQNDDLLVVENDSISGRKHFSNLIVVNTKNDKTTTEIVNQVDPKNDDESRDNSKPN